MSLIKKFPIFTLVLISIFVRFGVSLLYIGPLHNTPWAGHIYVDIWSWLPFLESSAKGLIPYVDFSKEYPVAIGLFYWLLGKINSPLEPYQFLNFHNLLFSSFEILNAVLFYKILKQVKAGQAFWLSVTYVLLPTNILLTPFRYESLVNIFFFSGILLYLKGQERRSTAAFALGSALKWYPAFFLFITQWKKLLESKKISSMLRNFALFAFIFLAINVPFIIWGLQTNGNFQNWSQTYLFHVNRPLFWDTCLGALSLWLGDIPFERYASAASLLLMAFLFFIKPRLDVVAKTIVIIAAALFFNRVYSTQFHLWFIPLCLIYFGQHEDKIYLLGLVLGLELLNVFVYPFSFTHTLIEIGNFQPGIARGLGGPWTRLFCLAILARSYLLYELIVYLLEIKQKFISNLLKAGRVALIIAIAYFAYLIY